MVQHHLVSTRYTHQHSFKCLQAARLVEHGYVRRYMRSLQIADVVNSMTDLMHMSQQESSPISALQQFHMAMTNTQQEQSPESFHSMPTVTSAALNASPALHASPGETQQQHPQQQQLQQQRQQHSHAQHSSAQQKDFRKEEDTVLGPAHIGAQAGTGPPGMQALISPRHSSRSGPDPVVQQLQNPGRPPTPRAARRS